MLYHNESQNKKGWKKDIKIQLEFKPGSFECQFSNEPLHEVMFPNGVVMACIYKVAPNTQFAGVAARSHPVHDIHVHTEKA